MSSVRAPTLVVHRGMNNLGAPGSPAPRRSIPRYPMPKSSAASATTSAHTGDPRVLFIDQSGQLGGAEICLLPLAVRCIKTSEVVLLSDGPFRKRLDDEHVRVTVMTDPRIAGIKKDRMKFAALAALPGIGKQILAIARRAKSHDVVFLNTQKALILGAFARLLHRKKTVWHVHDIVSKEHFGAVHLRLIKLAVAIGVDHVITNSRASADALIALTGLPRHAVPVVHNGVDMARFNISDDRALTQRATLGLPADAFLVGLFGRLTPWKGQHVALDAIARVPDAHLVLVGDALFGETDYAWGLRERADKLGIADRVHFAGFQHDVAAWMNAMDVIVHASTNPEPFGLVIIEAMAAGKPVIAANGGAVTEIVRHGENGLIVEPDSPGRLADAIETIKQSPELGRRLAAQGHADAGRRFSIDRYLRQMTRALSEIAYPGRAVQGDDIAGEATERS